MRNRFLLSEIIRELSEQSINLKGKTIKLKVPLRSQDSYHIVFVNDKFDKAFSMEKDFYLGTDNKNKIGNRYERVGLFIFGGDLKVGDKIISVNPHSELDVSEVSVMNDGRVGFTDGRHRYAYLRDHLSGKVPVSMDRRSIRNAQKFGYLS
jgi:hypothetical protein